MFDFAEQPWTLLGISVIVLFGVMTYRSVVPEKRHGWQWLIPLITASAALGTDSFIQTDRERIVSVIDAGIQAVEAKSFNDASSYISDDYRDSFHKSKEQLIDHAQRQLDMNMVEKCKKTNSLITVSGNKAQVNLFMTITLNKNSSAVREYNIPFFQLKLDIDLVKQNDKWLIECIELRSVNQTAIRWNQIG
jgi:hypothetical protein